MLQVERQDPVIEKLCAYVAIHDQVTRAGCPFDCNPVLPARNDSVAVLSYRSVTQVAAQCDLPRPESLHCRCRVPSTGAPFAAKSRNEPLGLQVESIFQNRSRRRKNRHGSEYQSLQGTGWNIPKRHAGTHPGGLALTCAGSNCAKDGVSKITDHCWHSPPVVNWWYIANALIHVA